MANSLETTELGALLKRYLGAQAGEAVAGGKVARGEAFRVTAAILIADIRESTRHIQILGDDAFMIELNRMFDVLVPVIETQGGDVLQFTGDGLLALFPETEEAKAAGITCPIAIGNAYRSACAARGALADADLPFTLGFGMSYGSVAYGSVGARERLNFTVISAEVSRADRLQRLCPIQGSDIALAAAVAAHLPSDAVRPIGRHALKGFEGAEEVFVPAG